ncbi:T9SS type A sorting domain-containing protein [Chryseobacterium vrystaatense]|uniref:Por secretion system C-terminal sorting domain-containing protein n=1 Tax=Chryseobacterium vrystaatense TaxID=307480 RepID=A0A1M5IGK8_9FLAO|nr:T9SS type A sorting domain-containing protein [Chryseobacterium vrystaatense]SHG27458.1 Por secretion system C-terminal sorting domain-containing protein [Chryseobacterium vrystaatense]
MKKLLLSVTLAFLGMQTYSQTLLSDNFENYNTGPLGTQGDWQHVGGIENQEFDVKNWDGIHGKSLHLTYVGDGVYGIRKPINWSSRTSGNDILSAEFETYLPNYSHSIIQIMGNNGGAQILIRLSADQPQLTVGDAISYLNINTPSQQWYKIFFTYNINDGTTYLKIGDHSFGPFTKQLGIIPERVDFLSRGGDNSGGVAFDNILISAKNATTLSAEKFSKIKLGIYPNPAADFIAVENYSKGSIPGFTYRIFDYTGKLILNGVSKPDHKIDIQKLSKGNYILEIEDRTGKISKEKFIKKN